MPVVDVHTHMYSCRWLELLDRRITAFMVDATVAVAKMMFDGFFDRYSRLKLIAAHAGGTVPDLAGRLGAMAGCLQRVNALPEASRDQVRGANAPRIVGL